MRPLFWSFVVAFNLVGTVDILIDYYPAIKAGLPALAGQLGATYAIPILYVRMLMITHILAINWMARSQRRAAPVFISNAAAS